MTSSTSFVASLSGRGIADVLEQVSVGAGYVECRREVSSDGRALLLLYPRRRLKGMITTGFAVVGVWLRRAFSPDDKRRSELQ